MVATGSRFKAGETLQLGWMINQFAAAPDGTLRLQEPDMRSMPIGVRGQTGQHAEAPALSEGHSESFTEPLDSRLPSIGQSAPRSARVQDPLSLCDSATQTGRHGLRLAHDGPAEPTPGRWIFRSTFACRFTNSCAPARASSAAGHASWRAHHQGLRGQTRVLLRRPRLDGAPGLISGESRMRRSVAPTITG